jgi:hypothetical protein
LISQAVESGPVNVSQDPAFQASIDGKQPPNRITYPSASEMDNQPWSMITHTPKFHYWKIRVALCYTAWDTATLDVEMSSDTNRTEPVAHWSRKQHFYTMPNITQQLGTTNPSIHSGTDIRDRHILQLKARYSWIPVKADLGPKVAMPFVQAYADLSGNSLNPGLQMAANWTALLTNHNPIKDRTASLLSALNIVAADDTLARLFDNFMETSNNSIAHAFSALITVLSGMAYYDELPLFHAEASVTQSFFTDVLFPQRKGGFWVVVVVVLLHTLLIVAVALAFFLHSKKSFVGSYWYSAIQLLSKNTEELFATCSLRTDKEVRRELSSRLGPNATFQLGVVEEKSAAVRVDGCETDWSSGDRKA